MKSTTSCPSLEEFLATTVIFGLERPCLLIGFPSRSVLGFCLLRGDVLLATAPRLGFSSLADITTTGSPRSESSFNLTSTFFSSSSFWIKLSNPKHLALDQNYS